MKVKLIKKDKTLKEKNYSLFKLFISFLQGKLPLKDDLIIYFLSDRVGGMTTGSSMPRLKVIKILTKKRLNRDILRTIAHEWIHEYQRNVMGREKGPDIGGQNEDEANAYAGRFVKMFEKDYPDLEYMNYE
jgi:hypothetical protein